jgi:hypothetical protein
MELASVDRHPHGGELVDDAGVAERVHAHPHRRLLLSDVASEDLADPDLGRPLGLVVSA